MINLDAQSFEEIYRKYSYGDEEKFRDLLAKRDQWYATQPYKTQQGWLTATIRWLAKNKTNRKGETGNFTQVGNC